MLIQQNIISLYFSLYNLMLTRKKKNKNNKTLKKNKLIVIKSDFESGNINLKSISYDKNDKTLTIPIVKLEINKEPYNKSTPNSQLRYAYWFYFKAENIKNKLVKFIIQNISVVNNDWEGFNITYSYDNKTWKRLPTKMNQKKRTIEWSIKAKKNQVWFAYYPPYPNSKIKKILPKSEIIGITREKNPLLMCKLGNGPRKVWLICGQHPGETISLWILEGFINQIQKNIQKIHKKYTFYIIPDANPDGRKNGNWYVSQDGINLNRDWIDFKSPETKAIKQQLDKIGYNLVFDIHGDEGTKNHFLTSSYNRKHYLHDTIASYLNNKIANFQIDDYYNHKDSNTIRNTLDDYTQGITIEGAMKHPIFNHKTLQDEPLKIGKTLADIFINLQ